MTTKKVKFKEFVQVSFSKEEKAAIKEREISDAAFVEFFTAAAEQGYKISVSYATKQEFYTVTLYGNTFGESNAGYAMSIRHADAMVCVSAFLWLFEDTSMSEDWAERFDIQGDNDW